MIKVNEMLAREREAFDDGLMDTFGVMTYELGAIAQNLMYAKNERGDERAKRTRYTPTHCWKWLIWSPSAL